MFLKCISKKILLYHYNNFIKCFKAFCICLRCTHRSTHTHTNLIFNQTQRKHPLKQSSLCNLDHLYAEQMTLYNTHTQQQHHSGLG